MAGAGGAEANSSEPESVGIGGGRVSGFAGAGDSHWHKTQEQPWVVAFASVAGSQQELAEQHVPQQLIGAAGAFSTVCGAVFGAGAGHWQARPRAGNEPIAVATASSTHNPERNPLRIRMMESYSIRGHRVNTVS